MDYFVHEHSIVRKIWGKSDTVLLIFAGSAAEFALNKAVDWLYFTGRLPADPIGRLFSTVRYAHQIIFAQKEKALAAIDKIASIHTAVENNRGSKIPAWAYRDVLFMLIHYSIASFEVLERKLTVAEKEEVYDVFYRLGYRMGLASLPAGFEAWKTAREEHLQNDLAYSAYTTDLYSQYKKHIGAFRYKILLEGQKLVMPARVRQLLHLTAPSFLTPVIPFYKFSRLLKLDTFVKNMILPTDYKKEISALDIKNA